MSDTLPAGVEIHGRITPEYRSILTPEAVAFHMAAAHRLRALAFRAALRRVVHWLAPAPVVRQPCWEPCPRHAETSGW